MINLIPPHAKRAATREYWIRTVSVWGFLLTTVLVVSVALIVPSYVLLHLQLKAVEQELAQKDLLHENFGSVDEVVKAANVVVEQLNTRASLVRTSDIFSEINKAATRKIHFTAFEVRHAEEGVGNILVRGVADTRVALADFREALERSALFGSATIPISDLAQESELPFGVTITMSNIRDGNDD